MKVGIFGNCQAEGLALSIQAWVPECEISIQAVAGLALSDTTAVKSAREALLSCDYILLQAVEFRREQYRPFILSVLEAAEGRAERFPVVVFNGFHPDCVYVVRDGAAVDGPLGSYHSALATAAWFEGLSDSRAVDLFNAYVYAQLGYFTTYDAALAFFGSEAMVGYDLASCIERGRLFMHTINHPTIDISLEIARQALDRLGIRRVPAIDRPNDPLAEGVIWPLYPEIADSLGLGDPPQQPDLEGLVLANFKALHAAIGDRPKDALGGGGPIGGPAIARAREFIRTEVVWS